MISVCAIQFKASQRHHPTDINQLKILCDTGAQLADLVVCPELACTQYLFDSYDDAKPYAQMVNGPLLQMLQPIALRHQSVIVIGFIELGTDQLLYNSALIIQADGSYLCYRKNLLFDADKSWASAGKTPYPIFKIKGYTTTVGICMDLNDNRFTSFCRKHQVEIIAFPTNWLDQNYHIQPYWAYRLDYPCLLIAANTYGPEKTICFRGFTTIQYGSMKLAGMGYAGNGLVTYDFDPSYVKHLTEADTGKMGEVSVFESHHCLDCIDGTCDIHDENEV
jgi:predicted amidohydrolase